MSLVEFRSHINIHVILSDKMTVENDLQTEHARVVPPNLMYPKVIVV